MSHARRTYLAGPMSGKPDYNYPAFAETAERLRALGHDVVSPPELNEPDESRDLPPLHFLRRDIRALLDCDCIAILDGWEDSIGARCEIAIAITFGMTFYDARGMRMRPPAGVTVSNGYGPLLVAP